MSNITGDDIRVMVNAAVNMAQQDGLVADKEKELLSRIVQTVGMTPADFGDFNKTTPFALEGLPDRLSGPVAKKAFILTLATMALVDDDFAFTEQEMIDSATKVLGVGKIKLTGIQFAQYETMLFKLLKSS